MADWLIELDGQSDHTTKVSIISKWGNFPWIFVDKI